MLIVDAYNVISNKICLICEEHWWHKNGLTVFLTNDRQKFSPVDYRQALELAQFADINGTAAVNEVYCKR